ncbi:hypothetical protein XACM_3947 [Xanthomonas euvesicatoria pv. citrumelo F1]|nr:hypothetical protein XACM_3947 [Xanthomonas euvesicatoria pv. citrumelo F1]
MLTICNNPSAKVRGAMQNYTYPTTNHCLNAFACVTGTYERAAGTSSSVVSRRRLMV